MKGTGNATNRKHNILGQKLHYTGKIMRIFINYIPTLARLDDGYFWCEHPDTQTEVEYNAYGDSIWVTRCANCKAWYDEAFNTFDVEDIQ